MAAPNLSRELFLPGLFIAEIKTCIHSVGNFLKWAWCPQMSYSRSKMLWHLIHNLHCLASIPLPPLKSSALLPTVYVWVCEYIHTHTCTCQVCIKASSIQLMMETVVLPSCESRCRPTPLYRCEYILFLCKNVYKCIHRQPAVPGPVSLMYCFFS